MVSQVLSLRLVQSTVATPVNSGLAVVVTDNVHGLTSVVVSEGHEPLLITTILLSHVITQLITIALETVTGFGFWNHKQTSDSSSETDGCCGECGLETSHGVCVVYLFRIACREEFVNPSQSVLSH